MNIPLSRSLSQRAGAVSTVRQDGHSILRDHPPVSVVIWAVRWLPHRTAPLLRRPENRLTYTPSLRASPRQHSGLGKVLGLHPDQGSDGLNGHGNCGNPHQIRAEPPFRGVSPPQVGGRWGHIPEIPSLRICPASGLSRWSSQMVWFTRIDIRFSLLTDSFGSNAAA